MATANNLINIDVKVKDASKNLKKNEKAISSMGKKGKESLKKVEEGATDAMGQLDALGNRFRYMSIVVGMLSAASIGLMGTFINTAKESEQAFLKLGVFAVSMGEDMDEVNAAAMKLAGTGLISVSEAAEGMANLLGTGLGLDKVINLMNVFINSSSVAKTVMTDTLGVAVAKGTVGFRTFREIMIDNVGIQAVLQDVWKKHAVSINKTTNQLTELEKYQAMYNYYIKEGSRYTGAAELVQNTFTGSLERLNAQLYIMKVALGSTLIPLIGTLADIFASITEKITNVAKNFKAFTFAILIGSTSLVILATALALVGALLPMLVTGIVVLKWEALAPVFAMTWKVTGAFIALSIVMGGLIYMILKLTGKWDKWINKIKNLQNEISKIIKPFEELEEKTEEISDSIIKSFENIKRSVDLTVRSFWENLRKFADKHDETTKKLETDIKELKDTYAISMKSIRDDFKKTMTDMELSHSRTIEDLEREISEETSKGIWADETRIRSLKLRLKRENEDYERNGKKNKDRRDEDLSDEKSKFNKSLSELQAKLNAELALEKKHAGMLSKARLIPILDEIDTRTRALNERLEGYMRELTAIEKNAGLEKDAIGGVNEALKEVNETTKLTRKELEKAFKDGETNAKNLKTELGLVYYDMNTFWGVFAITWDTWTDAAFKTWTSVKTILGEVKNSLVSIFGKIGEILSQLGSGVGQQLLRIADYLYGVSEKTSAKIQAGISKERKELFEGWEGWEDTPITPTSLIEGMGGSLLLPFQKGGIVPGAMGSPVPIMAHAGETVVPAGASPITININNPTVRDEQDLLSIANAVKDVLSRQQSLRHFT